MNVGVRVTAGGGSPAPANVERLERIEVSRSAAKRPNDSASRARSIGF
jgi:hypothetical protein